MEHTGNPATVGEIKVLEARGPWLTKSSGELNVLFALPMDEVQKFLSYEQDELHRTPEDIRGLRCYVTTGLPEGRVGGGEFHRIRKELLFVLSGKVEWEFEDVKGNKRSLTLDSKRGVFIPPFVLHTYRVTESNSSLLVIANTLFIPERPETHDTYPQEDFRKLQEERKV